MKLGEPIWHCKRSSAAGADIITYNNPKKYVTGFNNISVQPSRVALNNMAGFYTTEEYGEHNAMAWNVMCNYDKFFGVFSEGDLLYLDGVVPPSSGTNGTGANAIITTVREQNKSIYLTAKKLEGM